MKRYGNLFERVVEYGNLEQAFHNAARHKTRRSEVIEYGSHLEANLLQLQRELITGTYRTSEYKTFIIYEPKERKIFKLPFRDRVVHWAIMQVIEPIWLSNFTRDTYSCIRGRGIHPLLYKLRRDLKADPEGTPVLPENRCAQILSEYRPRDHETGNPPKAERCPAACFA